MTKKPAKPGGGTRVLQDPDQEEERPEGIVAPLAGAPHQRPLRAALQGRRLPLARRLQADRDRRPLQSAEARHEGHRPRRRARRLVPGGGRADEIDGRAARMSSASTISTWTRCRARRAGDGFPRRRARRRSWSRRSAASRTSCCPTWRRRPPATAAPTTSAPMHLCEVAADFAISVLKPGGHFLAKTFQGGTEHGAARPPEAEFPLGPPRQAAGLARRVGRALSAGQGFQGQGADAAIRCTDRRYGGGSSLGRSCAAGGLRPTLPASLGSREERHRPPAAVIVPTIDEGDREGVQRRSARR